MMNMNFGLSRQTIINNKIVRFFAAHGFENIITNEVVTYEDNFSDIGVEDNAFIASDEATFYLDKNHNFLLRSHLSSLWTGQLKIRKPPFALIEIGKVYRREKKTDLTDPFFYQAEGLIVDYNLSIASLKWLMTAFSGYIFSGMLETYFLPWWHPFTKCGAIVYVRKFNREYLLGQKQYIDIATAGMLKQNLINKYYESDSGLSGLSFGIGPTRISQILDSL
jgi:phenylalanyl-tRNA synthetase alpha chain